MKPSNTSLDITQELRRTNLPASNEWPWPDVEFFKASELYSVSLDPKCLYWEGVRLQQSGRIQPNIGRVQQYEVEALTSLFSSNLAGPAFYSLFSHRAKACHALFLTKARKHEDDFSLDALMEKLADFLAASRPADLVRLAARLKKKDIGKERLKAIQQWLQRNSNSNDETVLETFEGFVDQIDGETAYVTLKSEHGDVLYGQYSVSELAMIGIAERRRFKCQTVEAAGQVRVHLEPTPEKEVSAERERAIHEEIVRAVDIDLPDDDY